MLSIVTPAPHRRLTTPDAVRAALGTTGDDATMLTLIDRATGMIQSFCGRVFARERILETFMPTCPQWQLSLSRWPVVEIVSLIEDGREIGPADYGLNSSGLVTRVCNGRAATWMPVVLKVDYFAGYILPGDPGRDLPADIEEACIRLVRCAERDPQIRNIDVGSVRVAFETSTIAAMPGDVMGILTPYRVPLVA